MHGKQGGTRDAKMRHLLLVRLLRVDLLFPAVRSFRLQLKSALHIVPVVPGLVVAHAQLPRSRFIILGVRIIRTLVAKRVAAVPLPL